MLALDSAARWRPSGDQCGEKVPSDPGTVEILPVRKSTMLIFIFWPTGKPKEDQKTRDFPSGDQLASPTVSPVEGNS